MADWKDVMTARAEAEAARGAARVEAARGMDSAAGYGLVAVALELRALGVTIDYAKGGAA